MKQPNSIKNLIKFVLKCEINNNDLSNSPVCEALVWEPEADLYKSSMEHRGQGTGTCRGDASGDA